MQKKIIALAVAGLVSGVASAQSNVTISGLFDTGVQMFKSETASVTTNTNRVGSSSNASTTNVTFKATENLGNGITAGLLLETDPTAGTANTAGFLNSQNYLSLAGNFGDVKLGYMNNFALTTALVAQPFGTGMGGGYSGAFGRLAGFGVVGAPAFTALGANTAGSRDIRANNSVMYTSPSFSGFTVGALYRAPNSGANAAADADGQTQLAANYANGPLNVSFAQSNFMSNIAGANNGTGTHNLLSANYTFGTFTVYGGWTSSKAKGVTAGTDSADSRSWNLALKWQATTNLAVLANVLKADDKLTANQDRNLNALGLDYALSKRTGAYVRYESGDNDKSALTGSGTGKFTRTALGLRHSF